MDSDSEIPDLLKMQEVLHSLEPHDYVHFMKEVHFNCPFKTRELTDEIIDHWNHDLSMKSEEFQKIIDEREAQHNQEAERKRKRDLTRIQEMRSISGLDPLQLFPKEIWMMLIDHLPPADKLNIREVHETFQDLTEDTLFSDTLLPLILDIKVEPRHSKSHLLGPQKPLLWNQFLELRLVSKSLRNAVDHWFENDLISQLRNTNEKAYPSKVLRVNLLDVGDCEKFLRMKEHLTNPVSPKYRRLFTRSLHIVSPKERNFFWHREDEAEILGDFSGNIDTVLDIIGSQIWYFSFEFNHPSFQSMDDPGFVERYISFLGWLPRMPNLKWLKLTIYQKERDLRFGFRLPERLPPNLKYLERLDLELKEPNKFILPAYCQLLSANSHVKILNLVGTKSIFKKDNGFVLSSSSESEPEPAKIPLSPEVLILYGDEDHFYDEAGFDDLKLFQSVLDSKWPLRQINWQLNLERVYIDGIFELLGNFPSLEKVCLTLDDFAIRNDTAFLKLPELKHFELKMKKNFSERHPNFSFVFSGQFLLFAKKLETLIWKCDFHEEGWEKIERDLFRVDQLGLILDFGLDIMNNLGLTEWKAIIIHESNIWTVFPSLDTVVMDLVIRECSFSSTVKKSVYKKYRRCELDLK